MLFVSPPNTTVWIVLMIVVIAIGLAVYGLFTKRSSLIFIASAVHVIMGTWTLPSYGLFLIGLSIIEIVAGIVIAVKNNR